MYDYLIMEADHGIFSMVILSLQLIQEGKLSVSGERMSTNTSEWLRGLTRKTPVTTIVICFVFCQLL